MAVRSRLSGFLATSGDPPRDTPLNRLRALWLSVLEAGLSDAEREDGRTWLGTSDFRVVASLAGLDPDAVVQAFVARGHRIHRMDHRGRPRTPC